MLRRKSLALCLLLVLVMAFSACAPTENASKETTTKATTTEKLEMTKEETTAEETTVAETTAAEPAEKIVINVGAPKAPPIFPILRMIDSKAMGENVEITLDFWETPEQLIGMVQSDKNDMYAFPLTVIAKLYNKGMPVQLTNVDTWGVAYFFSKDESVKTWADLKGKQVYVPLQSSPPDILTQYFLAEAGLGKDDVEIIYGAKTELAQMMAAGKVDYGVMIEPLASMVEMKNSEMKRVMAFEEEWQKHGHEGERVPTAGIGTSTRFATEDRDLVLKFEEEYAKALEWMKENPEETAELAEKHLGMKKGLIMKAIPNMGIYYKNAVDAKPELDAYYQLLFDFNPKSVGGKVPDENMYFK